MKYIRITHVILYPLYIPKVNQLRLYENIQRTMLGLFRGLQIMVKNGQFVYEIYRAGNRIQNLFDQRVW